MVIEAEPQKRRASIGSLTDNGNLDFSPIDEIDFGVHHERTCTVIVRGGFGSGTLAWQVRADDGTYVPSGQTLTAAGIMQLVVSRDMECRLNLSGATTPSISAGVK